MARVRRAALEGDELDAASSGRAPGDDGATWVWEQDGTVAAFVAVDPDGGVLDRLYVAPLAQGAGIGSALLEHAENVLRAVGHASASLLVEVGNGRARHFYETRGWVLAAEAEQMEDGWNAPALRYGKTLLARTASAS